MLIDKARQGVVVVLETNAIHNMTQKTNKQILDEIKAVKDNEVPPSILDLYKRTGSKAAEKIIFERIHNLATAYAVNTKHNRTKSKIILEQGETLEDVIQELTQVMMRGLKNYTPQPSAKFSTYVTGIFIRNLINRHKKQNFLCRKVHMLTQHMYRTIEDYDSTSEEVNYMEELKDYASNPESILENLEADYLLVKLKEISQAEHPWVYKYFVGEITLVEVQKTYKISERNTSRIIKKYTQKLRELINQSKATDKEHELIQRVTIDDPWVLPLLTGQIDMQTICNEHNLTNKEIKEIVHFYQQTLGEEAPSLNSLVF